MTYTVYYASAGCLPDSDPETFDTLDEAREHVRQEFIKAIEDCSSNAVEYRNPTLDELEAEINSGRVADPEPGNLYSWSIEP